MIPLAFMTTLSLLGYHLTFDAEMSAPSDMSQFINTFANGDTRLYANLEEENYVPYNPADPAQPYSFVNGTLVLSATPVAAGDQPYTSGMVETAGLFSQSSGYFEIRASTPAAPGFWPAFWLLPAAYYPEIDILEQPNNSGSNTQYWTHTSTPSDNSGGFSDVGVDVTHGYHRYGFLWNANTIQYVFDGQLIGWPHTTPPSMAGLNMYMILNLAVGAAGGWVGAPPTGASSTYGIDYVRAFSNDPTVPAVSQEPLSSPDGINTLPVLTAPPPVVPPAIGAGLDTLVLQVAEDAYQGDAQFSVSVDGKQRGGVLTATANHLLGQTQAFTIKGNFGKSKHVVAVNYLNDLSGSDGNRNLYVTGATIDGSTIQNAALSEYFNGAQSFGFCASPLTPTIIGSGPDTFVIGVSEDATSVNAHYTISVDGVQQGGTQVAVAQHAYGQSQAVTVNGNFGPAAHTVSLRFVNGAAPGAASNGMNLYVDNLSYNTIAAPGAAMQMTNRGSAALVTALQQPDTLALTMAEDSWQGDAQAVISIDGVSLGTTVVTAANANGVAQQAGFSGNWGGSAVPHTIVVDYPNDLYSGPGQDRNLYIKSLTVDGMSVAGPTAIMRGGPVTFTYLPGVSGSSSTQAKPAQVSGWTKAGG